ncbi:autotransporter family protein [Schauerella aestuarii]|uniref:autotransporter family protein n=1 Tax=Schauerella aestuarii TaxID=2511204 RepID=UPI001370D6F9|nr:autotransporter outer membrane beta-barrel domain-containing protein [Achromobacter aestuarii]MYZ43355.1 autotransporter domain-containing protein [Achromobacter aestuarii]
MTFASNKWLKATVALSASYCAGAAAADLTVSPSDWYVYDSSANFPGGVLVNGGKLTIGGNSGGSGVVMNGNVDAVSNGIVGGFGTINGDLNVSGNARVAPGYPVDTPTIVSNGNLVVNGNLSMNNAVFDFETGYAGLPITQPGTGDNITVRGNAALNNTTLNVSVNTLGTTAGYYRILSYGGTLSGNGLTLGTITGDSTPAATIQSLTDDKHINLILGPGTTNLWNGNGVASSTRAGGGNGTWTALSANWNNPANAAGALPNGGYAIFTGAAGLVTVDGRDGPVRVSGIQFATDRYRLQGAPITLVGNGGNPPAIVVGDGTYAAGRFVDTIDNALQGTEGFVKTGVGSVILNGNSSGLTGPILIADGALEINGTLNGPMGIGREVVLAGVGQVGSTVLYPTAVISPGNDGSPMGTLTVNGDLTFDQGTVYRVHADPNSTASDRIHVTGAAYLDGSVAHVGPNGNYAPRTTYPILTADGGINGRFTGASSAYAFLTPTLSYDTHNAFMTLARNDVPIGSVGGTGNQGSVGGSLDNEAPPASGGGTPAPGAGSPTPGAGSPSPGAGTPSPGPGTASPGTGSPSTGNGASSGGNASASPGNEAAPSGNGTSPGQGGSPVAGGNNVPVAGSAASQVAAAVLTMTPDEARSALNMLSGEAYASTASVLQSLGDTVRTLPQARLRANLDAPMIAGQPTAQLGGASSNALPQSGASPVWAQVFGNWRTFASDGNASRVRQHDGGLFIGGDGAVGGGWRLGGALGYIDSRSTISDTSSRTNVDSYTATLFGGRNFYVGPGHLRFTAGAAYTWHDIDTKRDVVAGSLNQRLSSSYHASSTQVFSELGYNLKLGDAYTVEPFAGLAWNNLRTRDFEESGGTAALRGKGRTDDVTSTTVGLRGAWKFGAERAPSRLTASLGWRHAMGDVKPSQTLAFEGGGTFAVTGVPIARDAAVLGLGADMTIARNTTLGIGYDAQLGGGNRQHSGLLNLAMRF